MYWTVSKIITALTISIIVLSSSSCKNEESKKKEKMVKKSKLSFREKIERQVELELDINAAEEYDLQIKKEYINPDTLQDALILVNRKQWAHERADKADNKKFIEETGFVGPYNNVFVKLGGVDDLLKAPAVGSAADHKLDSRFLTLTSEAHKDFYVNYRIRNSMHRNYYSVRKDRLYLTFSCPVFDSIGEPNPRVFAIQHEESSVRIAKDIALYEGKIAGYDPSEIEDPNAYQPRQIIPLKDLYVYFIFDENAMKYKTPMVPESEN